MRAPVLAVVAVAVLSALPIASPVARAQTRFDPQLFHPAPAQRSNPSGLYSADALPDAAFELGVLFHYDSAPLVVRNADEERLYDIVGHQATLHVMGAFGLFGFLEIGGDVPIILSQGGDRIPTLPNFDVDASSAGAGVGDARLMAKAQLFTTHTAEHPGGAAMAVVLEGLFPTGDDEAFQGDDWRFAPKLVFDAISAPGHRFSFNFGYTFRRETEIAGLSVGGTFDYGLAAHFKSQYVHVIPEVRGSLVVAADDLGLEESPIEAALTLRFLPVEQLQIQIGGAAGLFQGFGAPDFRIVAGVSWLQAPEADRDGDGIPNAEDSCPDEPEDIDQFEDENGCPDPDNDEDGILDDPDECPLEPEDLDRFEDENGCPDPDNDHDRILDEPDECPNEPEDRDDFEDANGCPDPDNDQDGILDQPDQCPREPEDRDGFEDDDGCPDPDNDRDGILDPRDQCPNDPEDRDGFEDEDGCPDPDNDRDTILDPQDRCPLEPETMNGHQDEDGCPDQGLVTVTCRAIEIHDKVYFATDRAVILARSHGLLNQVAAVLGARPDIRSVRVEGHTDSRGSDTHNLDLSNRRAQAVREYLVAQGIAPERLTSEGFGETRPIDSNNTSAGRAENRRVEFVITEQTGCTDQP
jgi:outer membrane protein OmpA-like peptidoglycan-associated protein